MKRRPALLTALSLPVLFLGACRNDAVVTSHEERLQKPVGCISLFILPQDEKLASQMQKLYPFRPGCDTTLTLSYRNNIVCNSNQNAARKTLSEFPCNFLRLELRQQMKPIYDYYIDLDHPADTDDIETAFETMRDDLGL